MLTYCPYVTINAQRIQEQLNKALRRPAPEGPSGDGGGGGGEGFPGGQQAGIPVTQAQKVKVMGSLPQIFDGDRMKADNFIEEVKRYLWVNRDITEYDSPIKKAAFTLTLIKGPRVAGWVRDMDTWINILHSVDNNISEI